jgi:hypothetical protein
MGFQKCHAMNATLGLPIMSVPAQRAMPSATRMPFGHLTSEVKCAFALFFHRVASSHQNHLNSPAMNVAVAVKSASEIFPHPTSGGEQCLNQVFRCRSDAGLKSLTYLSIVGS